MRLVQPYFEIENIDNMPLQRIESAGRTCYKSEEKIAPGSAEKFVGMILGRKHESVIEHAHATVRFVHNRGFTHELVRHRLASYSQESTRYCNYSSNKFGSNLTIIVPYWTRLFDIFTNREITFDEFDEWCGKEAFNQIASKEKFSYVKEICWLKTMDIIEQAYMLLVEREKLEPQAGRGILPNDLKTEIVMTANFREWRHVFKERTSDAAHPDMKRLMRPLLKRFRELVPVIFDDVGII